MRRAEFRDGEIIFNQGDRSDCCFQIVAGAVEIRLPRRAAADDAGRVIERLSYGDVFGEMGIIDDGPRSASAVATEPTVCVVYSRDEILGLLERSPDEALDYIRKLIRRLRETNDRISREDRAAAAYQGSRRAGLGANSGRDAER